MVVVRSPNLKRLPVKGNERWVAPKGDWRSVGGALAMDRQRVIMMG